MDAPQILTVSTFAHLALLMYVVGLVTRNPVVLHSLLLVGGFFYILYYYFVSDAPLWDAIAASLVIGAANLFSLTRVLLDRSTFGFDDQMRRLYAMFPTLNPGQFRRIMKQGKIVRASQVTTLCEEGHVPNGLYLILRGDVVLRRRGKEVALPAGNFVGELSFLKGPSAEAGATVVAGRDAVYLELDRDRLFKMLARSQPLENAFGALFNTDLANKLAISWPEPQGVRHMAR